jgi:DNA helicase II / ATP-dependent DNA helicase PcrA
MFHADLHVHSRFSRACSRDCDLEHLCAWARRKGLSVLGTGDFTHPGWAAELKQTLVPAEPGLLRVRPELEKPFLRDLPATCAGDVRFMLSVEISTIYRRGERTRKVHHLLYAPSFDAADRITAALARIGNLASDGRPILGLDSRDLLEITLSADPGCFLVPAHVWTPWFAVLGSKSGFDTVQECYADLAGQVFAVETGLSSDPPMNWTCSSLDPYRLISNSDAHSPPMLGREATVFSTSLDYFAMAEALRTGNGLEGTIEFFPEEGKYHLDGHRKCGIRVNPEQTREPACPECGKPLTVGVLHRVAELADRPAGFRPAGAASFTSLVQLPEIIGEILATGPKSKTVAGEVGRLVAALGPELRILRDIPLDELRRVGGSLLGEAIARLRRGEVIRDAGYDGEYGTIRLFQPDELDGTALFAVTGLSAPAQPAPRAQQKPVPRAQQKPVPRAQQTRGARGPGSRRDSAATAAPGSVLGGLDPDQRAAATAPSPLLIIAGPGTGKTRTLTHRIAHQIAERGLPARHFLAITFTRRAAQELRDRLAVLCALEGDGDELTVTTFHGLGLRILRDHHDAAGLVERFGVAAEAARLRVAAELTGSERDGRRLVAGMAADPDGRLALRKELLARDLVDFEGLVEMSATLLRDNPAIAAGIRARWPQISVDEYQDIDAVQYDLLRMISGDGAGLTAIGDPDQSIYGFRGADVGIFGRFAADFPAATTVELTRNYRSDPAIVAAATQAIAPTTLVPGRTATAVRGSPDPDPADSLGAVTFHEAANEHAEAAWIAARIDRLLGGASFHSLDSGRADGHDHGKLGLADIAVLYRTDAQAGPLGQALTRAGLPYQKRSHDLLARRAGVTDILHEMRLVTSAGAGQDVLRQLTAAAQALVEARGERDPAVVDIRTAAELLTPLARRCGADLERFRTEISLGAETDALDPRAEAITLLTLHGAKGLEFDVVFLAGCENGLLPLRLPGSGPVTAVDAAEERRLLFVGTTRARGKLLLTWAARRTRHGSEEPVGRSPFLAAINPELLSLGAPQRARRSGDRQLRLL